MIPYVKSVVSHICQHVVDNLPSVVKALAAVWFFFAGIHTYIYAVLALTIIDVITGLLAAHKRGEAITSRKLRKGLLEKFALYLVILISIFTLDVVLKSILPVESFYLSAIVTFLISTYECTSILENVLVINPNIPFIKPLVKVFNKMGDKTVDNLDKRVDDIAGKITDLKTFPGTEPLTGPITPNLPEDAAGEAPIASNEQ